MKVEQFRGELILVTLFFSRWKHEKDMKVISTFLNGIVWTFYIIWLIINYISNYSAYKSVKIELSKELSII